MATVIGPKSQIPVVMTGGETVISRCGPLSEELKAEETHTNNNNRSRGADGVWEVSVAIMQQRRLSW